MGQTEMMILSELSAADIDAVFQGTAVKSQGKASKFGKLLGGSGIEFYEVEAVEIEGVFSDYCIGVEIPRMTGGRNDPVRQIQMHVWDQGSRRAIWLTIGSSLSTRRGARKALRSFAQALQERDPNCQIME